jgi:hypothetical protein
MKNAIADFNASHPTDIITGRGKGITSHAIRNATAGMIKSNHASLGRTLRGAELLDENMQVIKEMLEAYTFIDETAVSSGQEDADGKDLHIGVEGQRDEGGGIVYERTKHTNVHVTHPGGFDGAGGILGWVFIFASDVPKGEYRHATSAFAAKVDAAIEVVREHTSHLGGLDKNGKARDPRLIRRRGATAGEYRCLPLLLRSTNGSINQAMMGEVLEHMYADKLSTGCGSARPGSLENNACMVDMHSSREGLEMRNWVEKTKMKVHAVVAHLTSVTQCADVAVYSTYKAMRAQILEWLELLDIPISTAMRIAIAMRAFDLVCTPETVETALRRGGVSPYDVTPLLEHPKIVAGELRLARESARVGVAVFDKVMSDQAAVACDVDGAVAGAVDGSMGGGATTDDDDDDDDDVDDDDVDDDDDDDDDDESMAKTEAQEKEEEERDFLRLASLLPHPPEEDDEEDTGVTAAEVPLVDGGATGAIDVSVAGGETPAFSLISTPRRVAKARTSIMETISNSTFNPYACEESSSAHRSFVATSNNLDATATDEQKENSGRRIVLHARRQHQSLIRTHKSLVKDSNNLLLVSQQTAVAEDAELEAALRVVEKHKRKEMLESRQIGVIAEGMRRQAVGAHALATVLKDYSTEALPASAPGASCMDVVRGEVLNHNVMNAIGRGAKRLANVPSAVGDVLAQRRVKLTVGKRIKRKRGGKKKTRAEQQSVPKGMEQHGNWQAFGFAAEKSREAMAKKKEDKKKDQAARKQKKLEDRSVVEFEQTRNAEVRVVEWVGVGGKLPKAVMLVWLRTCKDIDKDEETKSEAEGVLQEKDLAKFRAGFKVIATRLVNARTHGAPYLLDVGLQAAL